MTDRILIDTSSVDEYLSGLIRRTEDLRPITRRLGEIGMTDIHDHFQDEEGPDGDWQSLNKDYEKQRKKSGSWPGNILQVEGVRGGLLGSIAYDPTETGLIWSTNEAYAAIHNYGGQTGRGGKTKMPRREYMWFGDEVLEEMMGEITDYIIGGSL